MRLLLAFVILGFLAISAVMAQTVVSKITGITNITTDNGVGTGYEVFGLSDGNQRLLYGMTNRSGGDAKWSVDIFYVDGAGQTHQKHAEFQGPNGTHFDRQLDMAQFIAINVKDL